MRGRLFVVAFGAIVLAACSESSPTGGGGPAANEILMQSSAFNPNPRTVSSGSAVTWTNRDAFAHNVMSSSVPAGASTFSSANFGLNATFAVTLTVTGTYQYFCSIHGTANTGMRGTVVVN